MNSIDRRNFLKAAGMGLGSLASHALGGCGEESPDESGGSGRATGSGPVDTGPALPNLFPSSMVKASRDELDISLNVISGALPSDIYGHAFVVSAVPWGDGAPVANGNGMIYRLDLGGSSVGLKTRLAKTPCYYADEATMGTSAGFQNAGIMRRSQSLGFRNELNTAYARMGDRVLVTFDGGRPYEIDPATLELATPVGWNDEWEPAMPGALLGGGPFRPYLTGAHPYWDEHAHELFLVNNTTSAVPIIQAVRYLLRWDGAGKLQRFRLVLDGGEAVGLTQSAHQMAVTRDYVLVMDTAFRVEPQQLLAQDFVQAEDLDTVLYIVRRADLAGGGGDVFARKVVIPRAIAHFVANYDNPNSEITLHLTHACGWLPSEWLRADDVRADTMAPVRNDLLGMLVPSSDMTPIARHVIDVETGTIVSSDLLYHEDFTWSVTLYTHRGSSAPDRFEHLDWAAMGFQPELLTKRVFDLSAAYQYRYTPIEQLPFDSGKRAALFRTDATTVRSEDSDGYVFPAGRALSSPQFVPAKGRTGPKDGYIVCTVVSDDTSNPTSSGDEFWIFDASDLAKGPVCRLGHPLLDLGYTLHTLWMEEIKPRTASYLVPVKEDYEAFVEKASTEVQQIFETAVYPHFP